MGEKKLRLWRMAGRTHGAGKWKKRTGQEAGVDVCQRWTLLASQICWGLTQAPKWHTALLWVLLHFPVFNWHDLVTLVMGARQRFNTYIQWVTIVSADLHFHLRITSFLLFVTFELLVGYHNIKSLLYSWPAVLQDSRMYFSSLCSWSHYPNSLSPHPSFPVSTEHHSSLLLRPVFFFISTQEWEHATFGIFCLT